MKNKPATTADYQRRIDTVVEYIRTHLDETLDLRTLAEVSSFSPCHFHRIVSAFLGEPPGEFIARTRIEYGRHACCFTPILRSQRSPTAWGTTPRRR